MSSKWSKLPSLTREQVDKDYGADLEGLLRVDSKVIKGILPNGATYYVRPNAEPQERAELRVALKVGSILEAEHERGIAHVIEHLAFRGSKATSANFALIKELEAYGVQFGAHQNAVTGFESTCFELHVPTDDWDLIQKAFFILRQLSLEARLSDEDLDAERQIVIEEWRQSRSGGMRASEHYARLLLEGSKYADRFPIGVMEVIENVTGETLRDFYSRYYCPSNCCIVAVGDFKDTAAVVELIKDTFSSAVNGPGVVVLPPMPAIPSHKEAKVAVFIDPEVTGASLSIECKKLGVKVKGTAQEVREGLAEEIFHLALCNRFDKLAYTPDPPFSGARSSGSSTMPLQGLDAAVLSVSSAEDGVLTALHCVLREVERVRAEGLTDKEIEQVKANIRSDLLADYVERDQIPSQDFCEELTDLFQYGSPMMALEEEVQLSHYMLDVITKDEICGTVKDYKWEENCVVHVTLPTPKLGHRVRRFFRHGKDTESVSVEAIKRVFELAKAGKDMIGNDHHHKGSGGGGGDDNASEQAVVVELPAIKLPPGEVIKSKHYEASDITELQLSNGLQVSYKCTHYQDDEVQLSASAWGGLSEFHGDKALMTGPFLSARWGDKLASEFGLGGILPSHYNELFSGMRVRLSTRTDSYYRTFGGHCSPEDLETLLHLIHLLFTAPIKINKERLRTVIKRTKERLANVGKNPHESFAALVDRLNTCGHPFFRPFTLQDLSGLDAQAAIDYFHQCYRDPTHFRLVLVGNLNPDELHPLLETYLGSIPPPSSSSSLPLHTRHTIKPLDVSFPTQPARHTLRLMVEQSCVLKITLPITIGDPVNGTHEMRLRDSLCLRLFADMLERRLLEVLRFELGTVYTVSVALSFAISNPTRSPTDLGHGECFIGTGCPPDKVEFLADRILEEVERMTREGPKPEEVVTVVEADRRAFESLLRTNGWWLGRIQDAYNQVRYAGDVDAIVQSGMSLEKEVRESMSPEVARAVLSRTLDTKTYTISILKPQSRAWLWLKKHSIQLLLVGGGTASLAVLYSLLVGRQRSSSPGLKKR